MTWRRGEREDGRKKDKEMINDNEGERERERKVNSCK